MDYQKVYDSIINRAKLDGREKVTGVYYELHHILPRCLGGDNSFSNLVLLTAREHFIVHWLLHRIHPRNNGLAYAFYTMVNTSETYKRSYRVSSRVFEEAKLAFVKAHIERMTGTKQTPEHTEKIQVHRRGKKTVYNPETGEQLYVDPSELEVYLEKGWVNSHKSKGKKRSAEVKKLNSINAIKYQTGRVGVEAKASKGEVVIEYGDGTKVEAGSCLQLSTILGVSNNTLAWRLKHKEGEMIGNFKVYYKKN